MTSTAPRQSLHLDGRVDVVQPSLTVRDCGVVTFLAENLEDTDVVRAPGPGCANESAITAVGPVRMF